MKSHAKRLRFPFNILPNTKPSDTGSKLCAEHACCVAECWQKANAGHDNNGYSSSTELPVEYVHLFHKLHTEKNFLSHVSIKPNHHQTGDWLKDMYHACTACQRPQAESGMVHNFAFVSERWCVPNL